VSCLGVVQLRRHWWGRRCACDAAGGYHVDASLGIDGYLTRRLQQHVCRLSADLSFALAVEHLREMLGVAVSAETLRKVSHEHGRAMAPWQAHDEAVADQFRQAAGRVEFTTDAGKVNTREEGWKDLKIAVLQKRPAGEAVTPEQWDHQRLPEATAKVAWGTVASAERFCRSWRPWVRRVGVGQLAELQVIADGAGWIWKAVERVLTGSQQTLDIYHACQHVAQAGRELYGEATAESAAFLERGRQQLLRDGWAGVCGVVGEEYAKGDTPARRAALERLVNYFVKHTPRLNYAQRLAAGEVIGSGAVEGQAKTLGIRLKARGARWRKRNVRGMTALVCVRHSDQWMTYWKSVA
jgi:hypothetical protein